MQEPAGRRGLGLLCVSCDDHFLVVLRCLYVTATSAVLSGAYDAALERRGVDPNVGSLHGVADEDPLFRPGQDCRRPRSRSMSMSDAQARANVRSWV